MTTSTLLLPGVDQHGSGYRIRLRFPGLPKIYVEACPTPEQANARILELREMRKLGLLPSAAPADLPLAAAAQALLDRKRVNVSRKTKRKLRDRGLQWWERILRPWLTGELAPIPLRLLTRDRVEDIYLARVAEAPTTANFELAGLKAALRLALERGAKFDHRILALQSVPVERRRRQAISLAELDLLADVAPDYARSMLLFLGTVGNRISELFTLTTDRVSLDEGWIFIPAELNKEGVDKWIDLMPDEVAILRRQLLARAPGSRFVFPTKTGLTWEGRYGDFHRMVWAKAARRAAAVWRQERELDEEAPTPFDGLTPHDLRATAATAMRDAGFSRESTAARLGHADTGRLLDRIYDQGDRRQRVRHAIDTHAPGGLRATLGGRPANSVATAAELPSW